MTDKFMYGSSILQGSATTPGVSIPHELKVLIPDILKACTDFGLDFYPTVVQMLTYDEISEVAAYGGFPVRYPHWRWGMEYEELQRGYMYGMHRIYEMVLNTNPCYIYWAGQARQRAQEPARRSAEGRRSGHQRRHRRQGLQGHR